MKIFGMCVVSFAVLACASVPQAKSNLDGLDTFGSKRISAEIVEDLYGRKIDEFAHLQIESPEKAEPLHNELTSSIKERFGFAFVALSLITYFAPNPGNYLTIDVVEPADVAKRMSFSKKPVGHFADPDGLIELWDQYQKTFWDLQRSGKLQYPKSCPAWHCIAGFEHPDLKPFLEKFDRLAIKNEKILAEILKNDKRVQYRASAAYALAHIRDGNKLVSYMTSAIDDSSNLVRNNAVRVLAFISYTHQEIEIPVEPILRVLNYPEATDRNKASSTLETLSRVEKNKEPIIRLGGMILLEMLKLKQPNNHDPAYAILKNISRKNFAERDYASWEAWLNQQLNNERGTR